MARPVLSQLNLIVEDMEATMAFYRRLGVEIPEPFRFRTGIHHVDVEMPEGLHFDFDSPALAQAYDAGYVPGSGVRAVIGFSVETREAVDAHYREMTEAGHRGLQPPYDTFWGSRYTILEDPDGNHVGVMSPPDPARRRAPPDL